MHQLLQAVLCSLHWLSDLLTFCYVVLKLLSGHLDKDMFIFPLQFPGLSNSLKNYMIGLSGLKDFPSV